MNFQFSVFELIVLIGIAQGFIITALIWLKKSNSISKLLLSAVLVVFNLLCIKILIHSLGLWQNQYLRYFPLAFELAIAPLIWLYVSSLVKVKFKFTKNHLLHFIPFLLFFTYALLVYFTTLKTNSLIIKDNIANNWYFNTVKQIEDFLCIISSAIYWYLGIVLVRKYKVWLEKNTANTDFPTFSWLRNISYLMAFLIICLIVSIVFDTFNQNVVNSFARWQFFFIYVAGIVYYLGFRGYSFNEILQKNENLELDQIQVFSNEGNLNIPNSPLSPEYTKIKNDIINALESNKLFLDPELNLQKLANNINVHPNLVSAVINKSFDKSFRTLINEYRIKEIKSQFTEAIAKKYSLMGMAYEVGFNSEASFYRIFKEMEGQSPNNYFKVNNKTFNYSQNIF